MPAVLEKRVKVVFVFFVFFCRYRVVYVVWMGTCMLKSFEPSTRALQLVLITHLPVLTILLRCLVDHSTFSRFTAFGIILGSGGRQLNMNIFLALITSRAAGFVFDRMFNRAWPTSMSAA